MSRAATVMGWPAFRTRAGNPYNWLLYTAVERQGWRVEEFSPWRLLAGRPAVWHLHWPEKFLNRPRGWSALLRSAGVLLLVWLARRAGVRIVWTAHNLESHDRRHPRLERWFWPLFTRQVDGVVGLTREGLRAVRERFPALARTPGFVVPHGHYRGEYPGAEGREEARAALGIAPGARVVLFFGQLREYKNVPRLVRAFRGVEGGDLALLVAGRPVTEELAAHVRAEAGGDPRVRLRLEHVPEEEVQRWFAAAELVVLPYAEILNSGTALLALSLDRPVLVPRLGAMEELQRAATPRWVRTYDGALTSAELERALAWAREEEREPRAPLEEMEWDRIARRMAGVYASLPERAGVRAPLVHSPNEGP